MTGLLLSSYFLSILFGNTSPIFKELTVSSVAYLVFITLTLVATGEELGWRGYAYNELRKKYDFSRSSIILGLVWAFWHAPVWFLGVNSGIALFKYIMAFIVVVTALSVILCFFYERSGSIWTAILIHFLYNFFVGLSFFGVYQFFFWAIIPYVFVAIILIVLDKRKQRIQRLIES